MDNVITRRATMTALAACTAATLVPSAAAAIPTQDTAALPPEWLDLVAAYRRAFATAAIDGEAFAAAERAFAAQSKPEPSKAVRLSPVDQDMTLRQIAALPAEVFDHSDPAWQAWRDERDATSARMVDPANETWMESLSAADAAMMAVQDYPSTTPAMMAEKLRLLADHYSDDIPDARELAGVIADARRFAVVRSIVEG